MCNIKPLPEGAPHPATWTGSQQRPAHAAQSSGLRAGGGGLRRPERGWTLTWGSQRSGFRRPERGVALTRERSLTRWPAGGWVWVRKAWKGSSAHTGSAAQPSGLWAGGFGLGRAERGLALTRGAQLSQVACGWGVWARVKNAWKGVPQATLTR